PRRGRRTGYSRTGRVLAGDPRAPRRRTALLAQPTRPVPPVGRPVARGRGRADSRRVHAGEAVVWLTEGGDDARHGGRRGEGAAAYDPLVRGAPHARPGPTRRRVARALRPGGAVRG